MRAFLLKEREWKRLERDGCCASSSMMSNCPLSAFTESQEDVVDVLSLNAAVDDGNRISVS